VIGPGGTGRAQARCRESGSLPVVLEGGGALHLRPPGRRNRSCRVPSPGVRIEWWWNSGGHGRTACGVRSRLRSEPAGKKSYQYWGPSAYRCWQVVRTRQPPCRQMCRRMAAHRGRSSRSVRKRSPTSAWGRFTSSTRRTPGRRVWGNNTPSVGAEVAAAAEAAGAAAEPAEAAAAAVAAAAAAAVAAAVCHGAPAAGASATHFRITLRRR
jgi:hypothetical protein